MHNQPNAQERPRLFVELCCGSAAVTLKLLGGRYAVPPISFMGSKRGYAIAILGAMGLRCGIGADAVLLCDAGPWSRVWAVLSDEARCHEVASILRGWSDEDPRSLWERLREEHRGEWDGWTVERAAGWLTTTLWARAANPEMGFDDANERVERGTRWGGNVGTCDVAHRIESVAAWLQVGALSVKQAGHGGSFCGSGDGAPGNRHPWHIERTASRAEASPSAPVSIYAGPAEDLDPPDDCEGVYMFCDPPYSGDGTRKITGYAADMPRETVLATLQKWSDAGAVVCCSECVGLADGLDGDWWEVDITGARVGQRRTFGATQEWLTMNREPQHRPAVQRDLFD